VLSLLTVIVVAFVILGTLLLITNEQIQLELGPLFAALAIAAFLGLGVGTLNTVAFAFLPVWQRLWAIINRPLFIISGVFFTFESLPNEAQALLWWNPLIHIVGCARTAFYPTYDGAYVMLGYPIAIGAFCFILGMALLMRHRSFVIETR
jgi:capsular polysaccharide transport system permease protein